jgi:hypothetical protein
LGEKLEVHKEEKLNTTILGVILGAKSDVILNAISGAKF